MAQSGLITINLESYFPKEEIKMLDLKDFLYLEMILKEKDFRATLKDKDWSEYTDCILLLNCSVKAIIPVWAYMLISSYAQPFAKEVYHGDMEAFLTHHYQNVVDEMEIKEYEDQRIVIKGCSDKAVPAGAYQALTKRLRPHVKSIMYGEPCSTVPIYKKPK